MFSHGCGKLVSKPGQQLTTNQKIMKKFLSLALCIGLQTFSFETLVHAVKPSQTNITDAKSSRVDIDTTRALVQLKGDPLSTYVKTKPAQGKKIDFANNTVKSYRAQLSALRNDFKSWQIGRAHV